MKRFIAVFLVLCLMVVLVACETTNQPNDTANGENSSTGQPSDNNSSQTEVTLTAFEKLFHERLYCVQAENELYGYINISGEYVVLPIYSEANKFANGLAAVKDPQTELWGYIDADGNYAIEPQFKDAYSFSDNGLAAVCDNSTWMWGYIDKSGKYVIDPQYTEVNSFIDDRAFICFERGMWTMIDENGKVVGDHVFNKIYDFSEGIAVVDLNGLYGYIDKSGEYVLEPYAEDLSSFKNGRAFRKDYGGGYAMIDTSMNSLTEYIYDLGSVSGSSDNGKGYVAWKDGYCLVDVFGESGLSGVFLDEYGKELAGKDKAFVALDDFSDGLAAASYGSRDILVGYIDTNGNWVIEPQFARAGQFYNGVSAVSVYVDGTYMETYRIIDSKGNCIADLSDQNYFNVSMGQKRDLISVSPWISETAYKSGYMDYAGNMVIEPIYDVGNAFSADMSYAKVQYNGLWGMIDKDGNWLVEAKFLKLVG